MRRTSLGTPAVILALAAGLMAGKGATEQPRLSPAGSGLGTVSCPTPAVIETTIGFPVKPVHLLSDRCMYELTGQYRGAFVTLTYQPATRANDVYAEIRQRVKVKGVNAKPDAVSLGEGGWGYGSMGKKEAATVSRGAAVSRRAGLQPLRAPGPSRGCRRPRARRRDPPGSRGTSPLRRLTRACSRRTPRSARSPRRSPSLPSSGRRRRHRSGALIATTTAARSESTRATRPPPPSTRR